jgi:hypothetical protein
VDNLSLYKRLNQPLKAHKKEAKRVGINLVDPRHELISKIQASAPKVFFNIGIWDNRFNT